MPQLGETVTEGTITKWHKQVGEAIAEDEVLFEVSTDKVDSEVPSPVSGTVTEILVQEGETVSVGAKLAVIGSAADDAAAGQTAAGRGRGGRDRVRRAYPGGRPGGAGPGPSRGRCRRTEAAGTAGPVPG